jgi:hypothetical protein
MPSAAAATSSDSLCATRAIAAAQEIVGRKIAEQQIAVGDRRRLAAAAITGRTRRRAGTLWADFEHAKAVDLGDGAAAGAHRIDVHHRHGEIAAFDLAAAGKHSFAVLDQRHVARRAAHVEGDEVADRQLPTCGQTRGNAAGWTRQHRGDGGARGVAERRHAAIRLHDVFLRRGDAGRSQATVEIGNVAGEYRLQISVDDGRAQPVILADLR